eukprot:8635631-Alexandrium_andersonii.AAC.1
MFIGRCGIGAHFGAACALGPPGASGTNPEGVPGPVQRKLGTLEALKHFALSAGWSATCDGLQH